MNVCIIGGGIAGISLASMLSENSIPYTVYEQEPDIGGLIRCTYEDDHLFHRVGGHVFNSKNSLVLDWFWQHFNKDTEFTKAQRKAAILLSDKLIDYPVELSLRQLDKSIANKVINELISLSQLAAAVESSATTSFENFLLANFGRTLYSLYFEPYNTKIWKTPLKDMPIDWLSGKLPMASPRDILVSNIIDERDDMVHSTFYYPVAGGSQFIIDRLGQSLNICHQKVSSISKVNGNYLVNGDNKLEYSHIVFTGDIRSLAGLLAGCLGTFSLEDTIASFADALKSNSTTTMLCECNANPYSWIYLPGTEYISHRIIMTGNFSRYNNSEALPDFRSTCTVEVSGMVSEAEMRSEVLRLPFQMKPLAYNYCPSSYVIHNMHTKNLIGELRAFLERQGVYMHGRFAEWEYYNMDAAIESSMRILKQILAASR